MVVLPYVPRTTPDALVRVAGLAPSTSSRTSSPSSSVTTTGRPPPASRPPTPAGQQASSQAEGQQGGCQGGHRGGHLDESEEEHQEEQDRHDDQQQHDDREQHDEQQRAVVQRQHAVCVSRPRLLLRRVRGLPPAAHGDGPPAHLRPAPERARPDRAPLRRPGRVRQPVLPGLANYPELLELHGPSSFAPWAEWIGYFADAELRETFRLKANGRADDDGYTRLGCPAIRRGATLGCDVRGTLDLVGSRGLLEVFVPPAAPRPDVRTKNSLTVPPDVTTRSMDLEWGSKAWYDSFVRRRPRVEGINDILKNPTFASLSHMNIRVRGRAKVGLFAAFAAAITGAKATRTRRRTHAIDQLLPAKARVDAGPRAARAP